MQATLIPDGKVLGAGLTAPAEASAIQSATTKPLIGERYYGENLFTLHGILPPAGEPSAPMGISVPDWWPWQPKKENKETEEEPKGSEEESIPKVYVRQETSIVQYLTLAGFLLLGVWVAKRF